MKIAVIINQLPKTNLSPARSVGKLLSILPNDSDIYFYGIGYNNELLPKLGSNFHPTFYEKSDGMFGFLKKQKQICKNLENVHPDVVLFWIADKMYKVMSFCKTKNIPSIIWVFGNTFDFIQNKIKRLLYRQIFVKMLKDASFVAEEHPGVMKLLECIDVNQRFTNKIQFPYLSIYCDYPLFTAKKEFSKKHSKFLVISRLAKEKNIDLIASAFLSLFKNNNEVSLEIIGSGPLEEELKEKFKTERNIKFSGWKDKEYIMSALREANYYVLASSSEGFPSTVQEAIKSKALVVAYPVGGLVSFLNDSNSVIINSLTVESIERSIGLAFDMDDRKKQVIIENAVKDLDKDFSFVACQEKMKQALEFAIQSKR